MIQLPTHGPRKRTCLWRGLVTVLVIVDGKIYIIGGSASDREQWRLDSVDIYDPTAGTWTKGKSMNHARGVASVSVVNGKIYVMGGMGWPQIPNHRGPFLSSVEVFDPKRNQWTENN